MRPKSFVLDLLSASGAEGLPVSALVRAGEVMGLQGNAMRVCLSRLKRADFVRCDARGHYALGPAAQALSEQVAAWRQLESQAIRWDGSWLAIHLDRLSSGQRKQARQRDRALSLLGFATWRPGLCVRPNNLHGGVAGVRERLARLGVDAAQPVFELHRADTELASLWDSESLDRGYLDGIAALEASRTRVAELELEAAAAETFRVGGEALRSLAFDPLLPPPIVDVRARRRYARAVEAYDRLGRKYWSTLLETTFSRPSAQREPAANALQSFSAQLEA